AEPVEDGDRMREPVERLTEPRRRAQFGGAGERRRVLDSSAPAAKKRAGALDGKLARQFTEVPAPPAFERRIAAICCPSAKASRVTQVPRPPKKRAGALRAPCPGSLSAAGALDGKLARRIVNRPKSRSHCLRA